MVSAAFFDKRTVLVKGEESAAIIKIDLSKWNSEGEKSEQSEQKAMSNLNGMKCDNFKQRPIAVMIAEDEEARPLSGISSADLVIEMPVVTGSITRMMALFVCEEPKEIGSIRSARHDFIALARGYDAILAHWGGSHLALRELEKRTLDNLDALPNYFDVFYRKKWVSAPHNGFTSMRRMLYGAQNLKYRLVSNFSGYTFIQREEGDKRGGKLKIEYRHPYDIEYEYNPATNSYYRWRGGREEIDRLTQLQIGVKNVAVLRTKSRQIEDGYNDVDVIGSGEAMVYRNGEEIKGFWTKKSESDVLRFIDENKQEIAFIPGAIWIEIIESDTAVAYKP